MPFKKMEGKEMELGYIDRARSITELFYFIQTLAPGRRGIEDGKRCVHNVLKSHAKSYRLYDRVFRPHQHGKVGVVIFTQWYEPKDPGNPSHVKLAEFAVHIVVNYLVSNYVYLLFR